MTIQPLETLVVCAPVEPIGLDVIKASHGVSWTGSPAKPAIGKKQGGHVDGLIEPDEDEKPMPFFLLPEVGRSPRGQPIGAEVRGTIH